ncbi:prepilin peptidase [Acetobacter conturbans]|uniref:Prepilin leader peptidase/N-methyltransferase n=1 Tax=Acetobacter conturbans TaxID=1737472 RepID=A0ABX0K1V7_9PROT|nr:A24 family peptidase [Acetobacter conturbans]NHN87699.1 prepilin peptidase [Acetobacter conturbans]
MTDTGFLIPFLAAPFVGSFLGVLIRRIPRGEPFAGGRSRCESCHSVLGIPDLVPVLSWLALKGRCRHCRAPIAIQHVLVELAACAVPVITLLAYALVSVVHGLPPFSGLPEPLTFLFDCILGWGFLALCWIDILCFRLPDVLTLPLVLIGLCEGLWEGGMDGGYDRALGAATGWGLLAFVGWAYRRLRGRVGIGGGDAKLLAAAGAWTGVAAIPTILVLASCVGIAQAVTMLVRQRRLSMTLAIPFGPPLAIATWIVRIISQSG